MRTVRNKTGSDATLLVPGLPPQVIAPGASVDVPDDLDLDAEVWGGGTAEATVLPEPEAAPEAAHLQVRKRTARK